MMLIDDDEAVVFIHQILLKKLNPNLRFTLAGNGREALEFADTVKIPEDCPQLILLDINMPLMNGWEFLEECHRRDPAGEKDVIVFVVTSSLNPDDLERARSFSKVSEYFTKPLDFVELEEAIGQHFSIPKSASA